MRILHSLFRNKRGVSEIIASLILILIVSAAGVLAYSISLTAFSSSTSDFQLQTGLREEKARERFSIIGVRNTTRVNQLNLTIFNYGEIEVTIDSAYVEGTKVIDLAGKGVIVGKEQLTTVQFISTVSIQSGVTYEILVASSRGGKNAVFWKA
jgi:flagellin-like protein